jgi:hypothetical protein
MPHSVYQLTHLLIEVRAAAIKPDTSVTIGADQTAI